MATPIDKPRFNEIPWDNVIPKFDQGSFRFKAVKADAWNAYFPYQLLLVHEEAEGDYTITPWRYTLPISPQQLQISMQVADRLEPTLTGYNETHGGAPFRMISFSGTMGNLPEGPETGRGSVVEGSEGGSFLTSFTQPLVSAAQTLVKGSPSRIRNEHSDATFPDLATGFFYFHQLRHFLEGYLAIKGRAEPLTQGQEDDGGDRILGPAIYPNRLRLAFCMWKDESVYLCRLANFEMSRDASSPLEYRYSLQLQAYRRVELAKKGRAFQEFRAPVPKKNVLAQVLNRIDAVRKIVANAANIVNLGIVGPLALLNELSRQISGIIKDTLGIVRSILDMPAAFVNGVLNAAFEIQQQALAGKIGIEESFRRLQGLPKAVEDKLTSLGWNRKGPTVSGVTAQFGIQTNNGAAVGGAGNSGKDFRRPDIDGGQQMNDTNIDPTELLQELPELAELQVDAFPLSTEQRDQLNAEIAASTSISVADVEAIRASAQQSLDSYATAIGAWDQAYSDTYGLPTSTVTQREPNREELDVLFAINDFLMGLDQFITYLQEQGGSNEPTMTSIEYVAGLAERSGIDFAIPRSKYAVPFPYGSTLERVALQYLGDANRWHEIAVLNGLRAPYVDEVGFELPLLVNGNQNEIVVASRDNLFVGQPIWLSSSTIRRESRRILGIRQSSPSTFVLTLSGEPDLEAFTTNAVAVMSAYLPGTVNSRQIFYIPSDGAPSLDDNLASIPGVDPYDPLLRIGGVDWLLDKALDLVVTPYGDNPLAIGLIALTQGAQVAFSSPKGNLQQHPGWGLGIKVGTSVADMDLPSLIQDLDTFFGSDPALAGLQSVNILLRGPNLLIDAQLGVRGLDRTIPVLLSLNAVR